MTMFRRWFGLRCLLRWCPFRPDDRGAHCAFGCGRRYDIRQQLGGALDITPLRDLTKAASDDRTE